jgi:sugar (pentulose or hexulose) kinase
MMFAVIESVAFKIRQIWDTLESQDLCPHNPVIRLCGGVSKNDFICQQISNLLGQPVERVEEPDFCCARGTALLCGLSAGNKI